MSTAPARAAFRATTLLVLGLSICLWASGCTNINTRLAMNKGINEYKSKEYDKAVESFKQASAVTPITPMPTSTWA